MDHYILVDGLPVLEPDIIKWAQWLETANRTLGDDRLPNGVRVSTVFLGLDHSWVGKDPVLWETMVFMNGELDEYQERYTNNVAAALGHVRALRIAKGEIVPE